MSMILTPTKVKNIEFKNKVVMAPMANFRLPSKDGVMGDELLKYYLNYTDKEIGLIILQAMFVMPSFENLPWAFRPEHMVPLKKIVDVAHEHGSRIFLQLVMNGKEFEHKGGINGLVIEELEEIRDSFIASAKLCKETGFDGTRQKTHVRVLFGANHPRFRLRTRTLAYCDFCFKFSFPLLKKVRSDAIVMTRSIAHVAPPVRRKMNFQLTFFKFFL